MIDIEKREQKEQEKKKTRQRMQVKVDPNNYEFIPAQKETDYYDNDVNQRVGIYVRVSTDDVRQTTSFELQKKYYEDFVTKHPNWTLVKIYADEGISGTSLDHRVGFNEMISDAKSGKLDMIITKSVSRFARNVLICIGMVNTQFLSIPYQKIFPRVKKLSFGYVKINSADEILRKKRENT